MIHALSVPTQGDAAGRLRGTDPNRRVAEFSNTLVNEEGERVQQHWRISIPEPYELPGPFDQDVWVAVQTLVGMRGGMPPDGRLYFSLYELLGVMRKARKWASVGLMIAAAVITPTPDALSMLIVWAPMYLLFELGLILARFARRRKPVAA